MGGRLVGAIKGRTFPVSSPATRELVGNAARADADDVSVAVAAARDAQVHWAARPARERGALVAECGRLLTAHVEELGRLSALETGKALRTEGRVEAGVFADVFAFYGGLASELKGETIPFNPKMLTITLREPIGVVGAILPWNAPLLLMALKIAPAMVAGNAVVVKSAEEAPFGVLRTCEILVACSRQDWSMSYRALAKTAARHWSSIRMSARSPLPARSRPAGLCTARRRKSSFL